MRRNKHPFGEVQTGKLKRVKLIPKLFRHKLLGIKMLILRIDNPLTVFVFCPNLYRLKSPNLAIWAMEVRCRPLRCRFLSRAVYSLASLKVFAVFGRHTKYCRKFPLFQILYSEIVVKMKGFCLRPFIRIPYKGWNEA